MTVDPTRGRLFAGRTDSDPVRGGPVPSVMAALPLRLPPESDLRASLQAAVAAHAHGAAVVVSGIGSLRTARVRLAGAHEPIALRGDLEILTLAGTLARNGAHLHMTVADSAGRVTGGHVAEGCIVRTTAEVTVLLLPQWSFDRELDPATGFAELVVSRRATGKGG